MPAENGEFRKFTADEIQNRLETSLESKLDTTAEPGDLVTKQLEAEAETLAANQEQSLEKVYYAAYLEDATGRELEKVVDVIGISRLDATPSSGTVKFWRKTPATSSYTIPQGITVQTEGNSAIEYATSEQNELPYLDGWEAGDLRNWIGDTASFSVVSPGLTDEYALELPATNNVEIKYEEGQYQIGTTFDLDIKPSSNSITEIRFGYQDSSNYHRAVIDAATGELKLETIEDGSSNGSNASSTSIPTSNSSHVEVEWSLYGDNVLKLYSTENKDTLIGSVTLDQVPLWSDGNVTIKSNDGTATALVDEFSSTEVICNIVCESSGVDTNIGPNQITTIADSVAGVEKVNNPVGIGDTSFIDTDLSPFKPGTDREDDEELRERAFDNSSIGGAATLNAIKTKVQQVKGFQSMTVYQNKEEVAVDGLPEHSYEVVVHGGTDEDVGNALYYSSAIDSQDVGGVHGDLATWDVNSDVTNDVVTMRWSRPTELSLDITLNLIVDDSYVGNEEIQSRVVEYIGGTDIDGSFTPGLDVGESVYLSILNNNIVGPKTTGVWEVDSVTLDSNGDGTDDTTTTANGADILEVAKSEVAQANARDGSIEITTTPK